MPRQIENSVLFLRAMGFAILAVCGLATTVSAQSCQIPPKLAQLSDTLLGFPEQDGPISVRRASHLSALLSEIDDQYLVVQLRQNGLQSLSMIVADLVNEADRVASDAEISDARRMKRLLYDFNQQALIACADSDGTIFQNIQDEREGGIFSKGEIDWRAVDRILSENRAVSMGVLLGLIGLFVGVLVLVDSTYRLLMAMLYNRKACRIPVVLRLGTDSVSAVATTLGRGGCRIMPDEPVMFDTHLTKLRQSVVVLDFGEQMIEARISAIYEDVSDFRFVHNITLGMQKDLLRQSTISPFYVKKARRGRVTPSASQPEDAV
ncbi:MAG: hypothetical protein ACRBB0_13270 [Pelagimonas sp.]|uniref:hypothetical protein n=1 Tax=Pelagimonas sp. TaxID=2073170 RepID=UPI003D6AB810